MPPGVVGSSAGGISVRVDSVLQSEIDDTPHDGVSLRGRPGVVHPIVGDGERSGELGEILFRSKVRLDSEMDTKFDSQGSGSSSSCPARYQSTASCSHSQSAALTTHDRPTWCRSTVGTRTQSA